MCIGEFGDIQFLFDFAIAGFAAKCCMDTNSLMSWLMEHPEVATNARQRDGMDAG